MSKYLSIQSGFIVLDGNMNVVDWFDSLEEAENFIEQEENNG